MSEEHKVTKRRVNDIHFQLTQLGAKCLLTIDGEKAKGVRSVVIHAAVGEATTVTVEYLASHVGVVQGPTTLIEKVVDRPDDEQSRKAG